MREDNILPLICRYLSEECTREEKRAVEQWLAEDADHHKYFKAIQKVWEVTPAQDVNVDFEEEWKRIRRRVGMAGEVPSIKPSISGEKSTTFSKDHPLKYVLRVAAVILLIAIPVGYFVDVANKPKVNSSRAQKVVMQKVKTARGERTSVEFSDGSKVLLNAMSTVRFPKAFKGGRREIYLKGEAFFEVAHNEKMPFIVHSNGVAVQVLGTEFNVNAYPEDEAVEVVVREGKVAVEQNQFSKQSENRKQAAQPKAPKRTVFLTKGQKTIVKTGALPTRPQHVSLKPYLAWVNGRMIFDGTPMREVIPRLRRAYHLNVEVRDSSLLEKQLNASFKRESPKKVLGIIAFSLGIEYELHGDTVIFKSKNEGDIQ